MNGTLALVGSGEYLPPIESLDKFLLSKVDGDPRVVCLPTAAGPDGAEVVARWSRMGVEHFTKLGAQVESVEVIDRATAEDEWLAAKIRAANFVYLSGGKPDYLHKTLQATKAFAAITGVLEAGGVVAGCSAGAMIWGETIPSFPTMWPFRPAFNRLPGVIIMPHYDEIGGQFAGLIRMMAGKLTLLGIEGNTALVQHDGAFTVAGSGGATVWNAKQKRRYVEGEEVRWR